MSCKFRFSKKHHSAIPDTYNRINFNSSAVNDGGYDVDICYISFLQKLGDTIMLVKIPRNGRMLKKSGENSFQHINMAQ
jgi:hypothetical protein